MILGQGFRLNSLSVLKSRVRRARPNQSISHDRGQLSEGFSIQEFEIVLKYRKIN